VSERGDGEPEQPAPDDYEPPMPMAGKRRRLPEEGTVEVVVYDEQQRHAVDAVRWRRLAERVLDAEGVRGDAELSVLFVEEQAMSDLNRRYMGAEGPTDVLSFPIDDDSQFTGRLPDGSTPGPRREPTDVPLLLGDVVVCPAVAARNAPDHAGSYDDELALLLVHGLLHVLGADHASPEDEAAMQARERRHLEQFHGSLPATAWSVTRPDGPPASGAAGGEGSSPAAQ
jgi:probable rRNA maturation factor